MKFKVFGVLICFVTSFFAINFWSQVSFDIIQKEHRSLLQQLTIKRAIQIEQNLEQATLSHQWFAYELAKPQDNKTDAQLLPLAHYVVENYPEITQIAISPNNITTLTVPHRAQLIGNTVNRPSALTAPNDAPTYFYDTPYNYQGKSVFIKHLPIIINDVMWGYISYTLDLNRVFAKNHLNDLNSQPFAYQLVHSNRYNRETILIKSKQPLDQQIYQASINLPNANLLLKMSSITKSYNSTMIMNIVFSIAIASIFTFVCYLGLTEPNRLRKRLKKAQQQLANLNIITNSIVNNVSDEVLVSDPNGKVFIHNKKAIDNAHMPMNIIFANEHNVETTPLFERDGKTPIEPTQHPINRALFNRESVSESVVLVSEGNKTKHFNLNSLVIKNEQNMIGALCISHELKDETTSFIGELSRSTILEMLEREKPLIEVFEYAIQHVQAIVPGVIVAISLADTNKQKIHTVYATDLPSFYRQHITGSEINERTMSSNSAISRNKMIIVEDINLHPYWIDDKQAASQAGYRACWSQPIRNINNEAIGSVDFYSASILSAKPATIVTLKETAHLVELALERHKDIYRLNRISLAVQYASNIIVITDALGVVEYVNPKFIEVSQFHSEEVIGTVFPLFDKKQSTSTLNQQIAAALSCAEAWGGNISSMTKSGQKFTSFATITPILDDDEQLRQIVICQDKISYLTDTQSHDATTGYQLR